MGPVLQPRLSWRREVPRSRILFITGGNGEGVTDLPCHWPVLDCPAITAAHFQRHRRQDPDQPVKRRHRGGTMNLWP